MLLCFVFLGSTPILLDTKKNAPCLECIMCCMLMKKYGSTSYVRIEIISNGVLCVG